MSTFNEADHPRGGVSNPGQFTNKVHKEAECSLDDEELVEEPVRYSFLDDFAQLQERFDADFEGVPKRFFTAELAKPIDVEVLKGYAECDRTSDREHELSDYRSTNNGNILRLVHSLTQKASSPADARMDSHDVVANAKALGVSDIDEITDLKGLRFLRTDRAWVGRFRGKQVLLTDASQGAKALKRYWFSGISAPVSGEWLSLDVRTLAGAARLHRKVGVNPLAVGPIVEFPSMVRKSPDEKDRLRKQYLDSGRARAEGAWELYQKTVEVQREGANFQAQAKYLKERSSKKMASAWEDKLYPDQTHQRLAAETSLRSDFSKVEIDNDVSPEEFADFEQSWEQARKKLPKVPSGRQPTLRIRKLGKHRALGMYVPHVNTVCIDVRSSEATVHEMGHYYDLAVKNSASLSSKFSKVVGDYQSGLKMPAGMENKYGYYTTPTEVFARGFEVYAHEKLGVRGRVVRPDKFENFDYAPFTNNPELKARVFSVFEETFAA